MGRKPSWRDSRRSVAAPDLEDRALGIGNPNSPDKSSGKNKARWSTVDLTGGGGVGTLTEYDVPHDLGEVPTMCVLETYANPQNAATVIEAKEARRENWSHSHVHMSVYLVAGSLNGCTANFRVIGR